MTGADKAFETLSPNVVVDGPSSRLTSNDENATILFHEFVPVCVRERANSSEHVENLKIRIAFGFNKQKQNKVLRIQVTNDSDPFFFHHTEVSEEDYKSIKVEQSILVEFLQFPHKLIELLGECTKSYHDGKPPFLAVLRVGSGGSSLDSSLGVIETNQFKRLSHISLNLKHGDSAAVKEYLAGRLLDVQAERDSWLQAHGAVTSELISVRGDLESTRADLFAERDACGRRDNHTQARLDELAARLKLAAVEELTNTKTRLEGEFSAAEAGMRSAIEALTCRNKELESRAGDLIQTKYKLDSNLSEITSRLNTTDAELKAAKAELENLRADKNYLEKELQAHETRNARDGSRVEWLETQLKDRDELINVLKGKLDGNISHNLSMEHALDDARVAVTRAEDRLSASACEIRKGNHIIERLQAELRSAKAKAKLKSTVISQQEIVLNERQGALDNHARKHDELTHELEIANREMQVLRAQVKSQNKKLEESQALLVSNQQMIQWLNSQVNEAHLTQLGNISRQNYNPSLRLPTIKPSDFNVVRPGKSEALTFNSKRGSVASGAI